jgi:hypothetical protein
MKAALSPPKLASTFRATTPSDLPRLVELIAGAFEVRPDVAFLRADIMQWKYWERRDDWVGARSYVLERDGRFVAHAGIWPAVVYRNDAEYRGVHVIDWAADSSVPGVGLALLQRLTKTFDFIYSIGGSQKTLSILPLFGFRVVAKSWTAARPLRPWRLTAHSPHGGWRLPARLVRNAAWSLLPSAQSVREWSCEPVDLDQIGIVAPPADRALPRNPEFFRYLDRCPTCRCFPFRVLERGRSRGYFVLARVGHQARLAGIWLDADEQARRHIVYVLAQGAARMLTGVYELSVSGSTAEAADAAVAAGFRIRATADVYQFIRRSLHDPTAIDFEFQLSDFDGVFFDEAAAPFLC